MTDALRVVASHGLPGSRVTALDAPLDDRAWRRLDERVRTQRLEGPLAAAVADGTLPTTTGQREDAGRAHAAAMGLALLLERELLALDADLTAAGVPYRVLKGPAVAHLDEPGPAWRSFGDLDLLVPGPSMAAAVEVLEARGGRRRYPEPGPGYDRRFGKGSSFTFARNVEVDLHRTLALGPFGLAVAPDDLWAVAEPVPVGGTTVPALDRTDRFLHAALHAVLGTDPPRLAPLRDVARLAPTAGPAVRATLARAARWRAGAVVAAAVRDASAELDWEPPEPLGGWARHRRASGREARWLRAYRGPARSSARRTLLALEALPGLRERLTYAWTVAVPALRDGELGRRARRNRRRTHADGR